MVNPLNTDIAFAPSMRGGSGGNTHLLDSVPVESRNTSPGQIKSQTSSGVSSKLPVLDVTQQPSHRGAVSKNGKANSTVTVGPVKRNSTHRSPHTVRGTSTRKSTAVSAKQNRAGANVVNNHISNATRSTDVALNPSTTVSPKPNASANPIAPSASSIAKERSAMTNSLNTVLREVMGKEGFVAPTDHRGYTTMIAKAMKKIKNPAQLEVFKTKIEEAGKPFRLNFGATRAVKGKQEALNSKATGSLSTLHQGEYKKIEAEFRSKSNTPIQTPGNQSQQGNQKVNGKAGSTVAPASIQTPAPGLTPNPAKPPVQTTTPHRVPVAATDANNSIYPNPELVA